MGQARSLGLRLLRGLVDGAEKLPGLLKDPEVKTSLWRSSGRKKSADGGVWFVGKQTWTPKRTGYLGT